MNSRFGFPVFALTLSLLAACAHTAPGKPESKIDPTADIPASRTFGWQPATSHLVSTDVNQRNFDESVRQAIRTDLLGKGYAETTADPDLSVSYEIGAYEKSKTNPISVGVGMGSWGSNVGGSVGVGTGGGSRTVLGSRLVIRVIDRKTDKEVWLGTLTDSIAPGSSSSDISDAVSQTLKDFPAKRP